MMVRPDSREPLDTTAEVETPEHVRFRYHVAGPAKRAVAYLIDFTIRAFIVFVLGMVAAIGGGAAGGPIAPAPRGVLLLLPFLVAGGSSVFFVSPLRGGPP